MKFVIGLGNPGLKFDNTRHNIGFDVVDQLAKDYHIGIDRKKHDGLIGQGVIAGEKVMLMKPHTYMNNSGVAIRSLIDFYKGTSEDVIVIYDDTSLEVGRLRIRKKGSAGGHNGVKSIIAHLGTQEFARVKVGVGEKPPGWDLADYVLSHYEPSEMKTIVSAIKMSAEAVVAMIDQGTEYGMNHFNGRSALDS